MSVILSIFSKSAFKEFVLPAVNNTEITLLLEHFIFQIKQDIPLKLEIIDGKWYFKEMIERIHINHKDYDGKFLENQDTYSITNKYGENIAVMVQMVESPFNVYSKFNLKNIPMITIGNGKEKTISYSSHYGGAQIISENHAKLFYQQQKWVLQDNSNNGVFVNDVRIYANKILEFGDHINIWGLRMVYMGDILAIEESENVKLDFSVLHKINRKEREGKIFDDTQKEKIYYHRAPRNMEALDIEKIEIEAPPPPQEENEMPLLMLIGPSLTMMLPMMLGTGMAILSSRMSGEMSHSYMYTGLITAACSGIFGAFWAVANVRYAKKKARQEETKRFDAYSAYLMKCSEMVKQKYSQSIQILKERYIKVDDMMQENNIPHNLWGRNRTHDDFLYHRLGEGNIPFQIEIDIPKEKFTMANDSLADKPQFIKDSYKTLHHVPVGIDLEKNTFIGVIGGKNKVGAYQVVYNLVAQLATQNCYTDVKLAFLAKDETKNGEDAWSFTLWLPHTWSENKKNRYVSLCPSEASDVCYDLTQVLRQRAEISSEIQFSPHYVLFVEEESLLKEELIKKYIFDKEQKLGFTTVLMVEKYTDLPNACECIIQNDEEYTGIFDLKSGRNHGIEIQFDAMNANALKKIAMMLANVEVNEIEMGGEIPASITFLEMYGVSSLKELNILERWKKNYTYENMKSLIGIKSGGQYCYLDLHEKYHGPHGLVAGTTGSGKSEVLQTYMLSLALNFSPDDIGFFIIDYKGGGMGNLFSDLPHLLGQISNLSGNQVHRAMVSIKSENRRRQKVFNENGVNNINAYTRLYKNGEAKIPIPHLLIIIDEFAELKREEPDFMRELISVAQVGRSLGVHLILATQKPSGTVDDNIWSNSKFRLCLRVQDRQDSMDMLHKADAAYLTQAGRGYLQVGNDEVYEQFQSGWSGAAYDEEMGSVKQVIVKMLTNTGRTGIVGNYSKSKRKAAAKLNWIAFLCSAIKKAEEIDALYSYLAQAGVEYPESEYNTKLLHNFILLYQEATKKCKNDTEICSYIVKTSERQNKKLPEIKEKTELDAIVEYIVQLAKSANYQKQSPLWLPILPEKLYLSQLEGYQEQIFENGTWKKQAAQWELTAMVGLCDDPENQFQMPLLLNFSEYGNHAVCGISMSGKSTFLQTVIYSLLQTYSPEYLNLYLLDFSSRMLEAFEGDAHIGGVLYENDIDTVGKFFYMLQDMIKQRKELFRGGNYEQYVRKNGMVCPAVVVVIDNMANFREKTEEKFDDILLQISRECTANGIYLLLSGTGFNMNDIPGRLKENMKRCISLEMQDKFAYADVLNTMQITTLPEQGVTGRGLVEVNGTVLEFQTCMAVEAADDYNRIEKIKGICEQMSCCWKGKCAKPIPFIPEKPAWTEFRSLEETKNMIDTPSMLPLGYNIATAAVAGINLKQSYCYLISGKARTGKTNALRTLIRVAAEKKGKVVVVEFNDAELRKEAETAHAKYITSVTQYYEFIKEMIPIFQQRNQLKLSCKKQAMEEEEIFVQMSTQEPYFIFLSDLVEYTNMLHGEEGIAYNLCGAMTNFQEKGSLLNIYFFAAFNWDKRESALGQSVYESFIKYKNGIHLGGCADTQSILEFPDMPFRMISSAEKAGCGMMTADDTSASKHIIIPFTRG